MNEWFLIIACLIFVVVAIYDHVDRRKSARAALIAGAFISLLGFGLYLRLDFVKEFDFDDAVKFSVALAVGLALSLHCPRFIEEPWVCLAATWLLILLPWSQGNLRSVGLAGFQIQVLPLAVVPFCVFLSRAVARRWWLGLGPPVILFIAWRDLGSSLIYAVTFVLAAVLTLKSGAAKAASAALLVLALAALGALHSGLLTKESLEGAGVSVLAKYQLKRFGDFHRGGSEEVQRTRVAVVSGGLTGHRDSRYELSRRVSEAERDLTVAIVAERTGLLGVLGMCAAALAVFAIGMAVARDLAAAGSVAPGADAAARNAAQDAALAALICSRPLAEMLLALGTSTHMFVQTGIPLPFFSDAPASLVSHMMGFALLLQLTEHGRTLRSLGGDALRYRLHAVQFLLLASAAGTLLWLGSIYFDWDVAASRLNRRLEAHVNLKAVGEVTDAGGRPLTRASEKGGVRPLSAHGLVGFLDLKTAQGQGLVDLYRTQLLAGGDSMKAALGLFLYKEFPPGEDIKTTLDLKYQKACDEILKTYPGGFVGVMDSRTGHILCASGKGSSQHFNHLLHGVYEPGSILKLLDLIALAERYGDGLESRQHVCTGRLQLGKYEVADKGHGAVNYLSATADSCNTFYASESWAVRERVAELMRLLGVNSSLRFQRFSVARGSYDEGPTRTVGAMQHLGVGPVRVSPIHLLRLGAAVVEGGAMPSPVLVLNDPESPATPRTQQLFDARVAPLLQRAAVEAVERGTGQAARIEGRRLGGKTGTVGGGRDAAGFLGLDFERHLVVVVLLKTKGYGGEVAAPEARRLFLLAQ